MAYQDVQAQPGYGWVGRKVFTAIVLTAGQTAITSPAFSINGSIKTIGFGVPSLSAATEQAKIQIVDNNGYTIFDSGWLGEGSAHVLKTDEYIADTSAVVVISVDTVQGANKTFSAVLYLI